MRKGKVASRRLTCCFGMKKNCSREEKETSGEQSCEIVEQTPTTPLWELLAQAKEEELAALPKLMSESSDEEELAVLFQKSTQMSREESLTEHLLVSPEYPSPVLVIDSDVDTDDSPSPVKCIMYSTGDEFEEQEVISRREQHVAADGLMFDVVGSSPSSEISRKKLQNIENLVQKPRRLNSSHDEARTDYIASLCENTNPDHRYISEILLASGLLHRDLGSSLENFQFHPSGNPINPELFLVLEQTKGSTCPKEECAPEEAVHSSLKERTHRKLIFDGINEILARKLSILEPSSDPWLRPCKLAKKTLNAQQLLRELCSETELLQVKKSECSSEEERNDGMKRFPWEDVLHRSENWTRFDNEISSIVLDVERLIFKDLVNEVVIGEATGLKSKPVSRRLFA